MECSNKIYTAIKKYEWFLLTLITVMLVCVINPDLLEFQKVCRIQLSAEFNDASQGREICLTRILINHEEVPISTLNIERNLNWKYADDVDDYVFYPQAKSNNNTLVLKTETPGDIELIFLKNNRSGSVKINTQNKSEVIDLYSETNDIDSYVIEEDNYSYAYLDNIIKLSEAIALTCALVSIVTMILRKASITNKLSGVCCILSFYILNKYELLNGLMCALLISCFTYVVYTCNYTNNTKQLGGKYIFIRIIIHAYFVFALVANRIFMTQPLMNLGVPEIGRCIVVALALVPFGTIMLNLLDRCQCKLAKAEYEFTGYQIRKVKIISFLIIFSALILISLGFYPAIIPADGVSHWTQAVGYLGWGIQDNTSAAFTILLRMCYKIGGSPYCFILLQIFLFSFICARVLAFFYTKGISSSIVYCISVFISVLPNNYMTLFILKTNPMYAILCIWLTFLLIKLIDDPGKVIMSFRFIVEMGIIMGALYLCRHNSFLAVYGTCIILLLMFFKHLKQYKKIKINYVIPILLTIIFVKTVTGPVYTHFDVIKNTPKASNTAYPLISPLAVAYNNGVELTEDTLEYMDRIRPLEDWNKHNRYHGDTFYWSEPLPQYDQTTNGKVERFKYYFKLFFSRPDIVIKDRLDAVESLWNIFPSKGQGAYNECYRMGISTNMPKELMPTSWNTTEVNKRWSAYYHETAFTIIPHALCQLCEENETLNSLVYRTGFSIVLLLYAIYFTCVTGKKEKVIATIPMIGTLITMVLVISWQLYQYFWVIHIINWLLVIYFTLPSNSTKCNNNT